MFFSALCICIKKLIFIICINLFDFSDALRSLHQTKEVTAALAKLKSRLFTVQELFDEFAVPFDLPELKLALCCCSETYDADAVDHFYTEIIDRGKFH